MNVDDMTDEEFIDYCRNGGELSGLITERHPKCDWCGCTYRVGRDGMCRNCRVRERRRTDPEYAQHLRDLANRRNARNREKRNEYARRYRSEHLAQARASARKYAAAHQREMAEYHRRWMSEHPGKPPSIRRIRNVNDNWPRRLSMSEKPFWEGKTCSEMAGLHVKVTFKNGTVATGVTDECGDIDGVDSLSCVDVDDKFVPCSYVESIELLDDPEYERIDNIENVQVGDIACTTEGNHFRVIDLKPDPLGDMLLRIRISEIDGEYCIDSDDFAYALRRKPKLPDHDGLWLDKGDGLWLVTGTTVIEIAPKDPPAASISYPASSIEASERLSLFAPFRPAKAVEA